MDQILKLPRITLQSMVSRASKGASCNKMLPVTGLLAIQAKGKNVTMITSDASNFLYATYEDPSGDWDFYVVTQVEVFSKLISKLTCTSVTLEVSDSKLTVRGNGNYEMELPLDDRGKPVVFPDPVAKFAGEKVGTLNKAAINLMLQTAKASVATTLDIPCYTGYYAGKDVITTDTWKLCKIELPMFEKPVLLAPTAVDLFDTFTGDSVDVYQQDTVVVFKSPGTTLYSKLMDCIDDFQADEIENLLGTEFQAKCAVAKDSVLQALDRLSLFVSTYDDNCIKLDFERDGLVISAMRVSSEEQVEYTANECGDDVLSSCIVDIEMLQELVKAVPGTAVCIEYGSDKFLRFTPIDNASVTQLLALKVE